MIFRKHFFVAQMLRSRASNRIASVFALSLLVSIAGCGTGSPDSGETVISAGQDLYLTNATWPSGIVKICFDANDGNNPTLIAEAQRVLAASWGRSANFSFSSSWAQCNYSIQFGLAGNFSTVAIHFCGGSSNSSFCPASLYDNNVVAANAFRGLTGPLGRVAPTVTRLSTLSTPGVTHVSLISDDADSFLTRFRYETIHEFGHALGFSHEQNRPDNFNSLGQPTQCKNTAVLVTGGTTETPFDLQSIMSYCATDPLTGGYPTLLSNDDVLGIRKVYGPLTSSHGFMITSDTNPGLAVNAFKGARDQGPIQLIDICKDTNPDCTWSYQRGMLVSDRDPSLAINAFGGAGEGVVLQLSIQCKPTNPDCTWTYKHGEFLSDRDPTLAINAINGAAVGTQLVLTRGCDAGNTNCTWTMPHVMLSSNRDSTLAINALNGAHDLGPLALHNGCSPANHDCTWTFHQGMLTSDTNSLAVNALNGANDNAVVELNAQCTSPANADCTWTWKQGQIISDDTARGVFPMNAFGGAVHLAPLKLESACNANNPDCVFSGLFAENL